MLNDQIAGSNEMTKSELILRHQLQRMLKEHRLTATELARRCGIAKQVLSDWLAGAKPKHIEKVKVIADYFNMSMDELCFGCSKYKKDAQHKPVNLTQVSSNRGAMKSL